ncbi:aminodeoxychorismate/anthranilate synthase component II [Candidatus Peregrinibacteria bacterium CG10_big_fil_rev_8_21_14_0_10_36_19]|nr:MAG: aminodeoxychorismate/anthranilate synthase component II [Candidatus Peregrinibacteria bacterium CG10_big_fil_rev_8_21_14_0_10_36_19]
MILIIDNYDSFTYNLYQQVESLGKKTKVYKNDQITINKIKRLKPEKIIISPGPKRPEDGGISIEVIKKFYKTIPILGVCLGHEAIGLIFGSKVIHAKKIMHGKTSDVYHTRKGIFRKVSTPLKAARYHSLILNAVPEEFTLEAWTKDEEIMAIKHQIYPLYGIQFHPESFMTSQGNTIMHNFLYEI